MHDPMTVAFQVPNPFAPRYPWGKRWSHRPALLTVWHRDPERGGDDDSCDWFNRKKKLTPAEQALAEAVWDLETLLDNEPHYPDSPEHRAFQPLKDAVRRVLLPPRRHWWRHPRYHLHHLRLQLHPWQDLRRWLLTRCAGCGGRFPWGHAPVSGNWDARPVRWFRGEEGLYHQECFRRKVGPAFAPPPKDTRTARRASP